MIREPIFERDPIMSPTPTGAIRKYTNGFLFYAINPCNICIDRPPRAERPTLSIFQKPIERIDSMSSGISAGKRFGNGYDFVFLSILSNTISSLSGNDKPPLTKLPCSANVLERKLGFEISYHSQDLSLLRDLLRALLYRGQKAIMVSVPGTRSVIPASITIFASLPYSCFRASHSFSFATSVI